MQESESIEEKHTLENSGVIQLKFDKILGKMTIRSLNETQREAFHYVSKWKREYNKSRNNNVIVSVKPIYLFITGSAGPGKPHLLTAIRRFFVK